jgi:hypothetical protein
MSGRPQREGGRKRQAAMTPAERSAFGRKAYLVGAVKAVVDRAPELTDGQKARIRAALSAPPGGGQLRHRAAPPILAAISFARARLAKLVMR